MSARRRTARRTARRTSRRVNRRQEAYSQPEYEYEPAPAPAPAASETDTIEALKELGELHAQGILTDEEFAAQKAKLLG